MQIETAWSQAPSNGSIPPRGAPFAHPRHRRRRHNLDAHQVGAAEHVLRAHPEVRGRPRRARARGGRPRSPHRQSQPCQSFGVRGVQRAPRDRPRARGPHPHRDDGGEGRRGGCPGAALRRRRLPHHRRPRRRVPGSRARPAAEQARARPPRPAPQGARRVPARSRRRHAHRHPQPSIDSRDPRAPPGHAVAVRGALLRRRPLQEGQRHVRTRGRGRRAEGGRRGARGEPRPRGPPRPLWRRGVRRRPRRRRP